MADAWPRTPRDILSRLVAFDTVSSRSNMALIEWVAAFLGAHGIAAEIIRDAQEDKANLLATIGPRDGAGIILSGHTDVVPVAGQDWSTDPFTLAEREGRLYARGTCDMKGFIACVLSMVPRLAAAELKEPVHLAFSYDEEVGCTGVVSMIRRLAERRPKPRLCIVGEPTDMQLVTTHKAIRDFVTEVTGLEGHSSRPDKGVNAIQYAARMIQFLENLGRELAAAPADHMCEPPYTTISVGVIEGGTAVNIIPGQCRFHWDNRVLPGEAPDLVINRFNAYVEREILPEMRALDPRASVVTTKCADAPGLNPEDGSDAETLVLSLLGSNARIGVSYATEAGHFQGIGIPTVVCGPGSILQAHKPDEFVEISQIDACEAFLGRLVTRLTR